MKRFPVLLKHLVNRQVSGDHLKFDNHNRESFILLLAILCVFGGYLAHKLFFLYLLIPALGGFSAGSLWLQKTYFTTFSMAATGIVSLIAWDNIFLDNKDYRNLAVLPIKMSTLYLAKFSSLVIYVALISAAFNALALLIISGYTADRVPVPVVLTVFSHLASIFLANLFVFLGVAVIQAILMVCVKGRYFMKVSGLVQGFLLLAFLSVFAWFPALYPSLSALKREGSAFLSTFPPLWFAGLGERLSGSGDTFFYRHAYLAVFAPALAATAYFLALPLSYKRFLVHSAGVHFIAKGQSLMKLPGRVFAALFLANPRQRAIFDFTLNTLRRSRKHKFKLLLTLAIPLSVVGAELVYRYFKQGPAYFKETSATLISFPLLLAVFLVLGLRLAVNRPVNRGANWVFRLCGEKDDGHVAAGLKKCLLAAAVFPVFALLFLFYALCWGPALAFLHLGYCLALCVLLLEAAFHGYRKVPFVSEYVPGKINLRIYGLFFFIAFAYYMFLFTMLGDFLLRNPLYYFLFYAVSGLCYLVLGFKTRRGEKVTLVYEEEPQPVFLTLGLDRGVV